MKNILFIFLVLFSIRLAAQRNPAIPTTTDNPGAPVPNSISNKFNSDYPNMHATWVTTGQNYRADYTEGSLNRSVTYDKNGNILSREEELAKNAYPTAIGDYYTKYYPNEQYEVWAKTDKAGNHTYYTNLNSETVWFDKNGKYKRRSKLADQGKAEPADQ